MRTNRTAMTVPRMMRTIRSPSSRAKSRRASPMRSKRSAAGRIAAPNLAFTTIRLRAQPAGVAHGALTRNTDGVIREFHLPPPNVTDLEPAGETRASGASTAGAGAKQVTFVMVAVLALVLVAGSLAGRAPVERPRHRLAFDEPSQASVEATVREGTGEAAAGLGTAEPTRPPENIPDGWKWRTVGPLRGRQGNIAVWTGHEVIYWGGDRPGRAPEGAAYDPKADRWRRSSRSPPTNRTHAGAVGTGREGGAADGAHG